MATPGAALLVDARPVDHPTARDRGIGRYTTGLLQGLCTIDAPVIALVSTDAEADLLREAVPGLRLERWGPQVIRDHAVPGTWFLATQLMLHPVSLDPIPSIVTRARVPVAAVMYDVIPYRYPERYLVDPNARAQARLRASMARTVDAMVAISEFSADTAAAMLDVPRPRIRVIGAGVDDRFVTPDVDARPPADRVLPAGQRGHVVAVVGTDDRKNTEGLLRAWGRVPSVLRRSHPLVIAAAADRDTAGRWRAAAETAGVSSEVIFTGFVSDDELVAILQRAALAVMPSFEEGFGLPVVEAAACGCPVVCSDATALPEVLDEPAALFDPGDPDAIAAAIERALTDDGHRAVLLDAARRAASRWRWDRVAADTVAALHELGPRWPGPVRRPRPRIGIAGSTVADVRPWAVGLARVGADAPEVECYVDGRDLTVAGERPGTVGDDHLGAGVAAVFPIRALGRFRKPWNLDHLVVVADPSVPADAILDLMRRMPCHLVVGPDIVLDDAWIAVSTSARSIVVHAVETGAAIERSDPGHPPVFVRKAGAGADRELLDWLDRSTHLGPGVVQH